MQFGRLISLVLCASLVACPTVCRSGHCAACPQAPSESAGCPNCPAEQNQDSGGDQSRPGVPPESRNPCEFGNCLCAGAVTNHTGLDLQIGHVLSLFVATDAIAGLEIALLSSPGDTDFAFHDRGPPASGRFLRLRIESLLI